MMREIICHSIGFSTAALFTIVFAAGLKNAGRATGLILLVGMLFVVYMIEIFTLSMLLKMIGV